MRTKSNLAIEIKPSDGMKACRECGKILPATLEYFTKHAQSKDGLHLICKTCSIMSLITWKKENKDKYDAWRLEWQRKNRKKMCRKAREYRGRHPDRVLAQRIARLRKNKDDWKKEIISRGMDKCSICGYSKCFAAIEFHHKNPKAKEKLIATLIKQKFSSEKAKELDKCISVCSNCHREIHHGQQEVLNA